MDALTWFRKQVEVADADLLLELITAHARILGHVQFADCPGRHEPGTGSLTWSSIVAALAGAGYEDWIGLEYRPLDPSARDFAFIPSIGGELRR
jgi:hydroxypyruvate isomerase